ncbi:MAG: DUF2975 domain-containing protein [Ignavibacteriales bacterium]|nr:DUF2975 domain-containing protein [Ignavibacteriales bacterium]
MRTNNNSKNLLKMLINVLWYGGLSASIILILAVVLFNLSVIGLINVKMPIISIEMNNHAYRFNSQYTEVKRIDAILKEFIEVELARTKYFSNPFFVDAAEQLYEMDFNKIPTINKESVGNFHIVFDTKRYLFPIRYFEHRLTPELIIGFSFLLIFIAALFVIILNNLKKIFNNYTADGTFSSENSELLKYIGIYFLIGEFVRVLIFYWINNAVARREWVNTVRQFYNFSFSDFNFALLFAGIIFLILSKIFQMGAVIKQENDLTV